MPLIERVDTELEGSLSSNIIAGLRGLLDRHDAAKDRFEEVTITIDEDGMKRQLVFNGRCVARNERYTEGGKIHEEERIYATAGGRYAYHARVETNWNYWSDGNEDAFSPDGHRGKRTFTVVDELHELRGTADEALITAAGSNQHKPAREYLDI